MARYRKIDPRIWNDAKFSSLSSEAKLLFLYLLTTPAMTMLGAVPLRASAVAEELGFDAKRYGIRYQELYSKGIVEYDERGLFWVKNFLKYNAPDNPKVVMSWSNIIGLLPECPLLSKVLEAAKAHCFQRGEGYAEAFRKGMPDSTQNSTEDSTTDGMAYGIAYPMPYQEQEQEYKKEVKEKGAAMTHRLALQVIPSEWKTYANKVRPDLNAEREFADFVFYFTQGKGSSKLRSDKGWSQAWQGWVRRAKEQTQQKPVSTSSFFAVPKPEPKRSFDDETEQADDFDLSAFGVAK